MHEGFQCQVTEALRLVSTHIFVQAGHVCKDSIMVDRSAHSSLSCFCVDMGVYTKEQGLFPLACNRLTTAESLSSL